MTVGKKCIRSVYFEDGEWWMLCGANRTRVIVRDSDDKLVGEPVEDKQDDERSADTAAV